MRKYRNCTKCGNLVHSKTTSYCRDCNAAYMRQYVSKRRGPNYRPRQFLTPEQRKQKSVDYYQANKERIIATTRKYYQANKDVLNSKARARYDANPNKERVRWVQYYHSNKEKYAVWAKQYYNANKEKLLNQSAERRRLQKENNNVNKQ